MLLLREGAQGPLTWMLFKSEKLFDGLLDNTFLRRFDVTPDGPLQKITVGQVIETPQAQALNNGKPVENTLELWIEPETLTLQKSRQFDSFKGEIIETYTQQRFNPDFPKGLFRAAAPVGYTILQDEK